MSDWRELSALYDEADALDAASRSAWLRELQASGHRLLPALERMLHASSAAQQGRFLDEPPQVEPPSRDGVAGEGVPIGAYRLLRRIGEGGMAEVWLAHRDDGAFQRRVAIKLLHRRAFGSEREAMAQRFARERDILASLDHPNIAALHDAGIAAGQQPWLALEYIDGQPLTAWCDERRAGIRERLRLFRQVLLAVQHAHAQLVIHRDIKPANILVTQQGEIRLLDFGIAKLLQPDGGTPLDTELTRDGGRPLTLQYTSPEQLLGAPLTTATDIYSLGLVLYELLCGERPYELRPGSQAQLETAVLEIEAPAPSRRTISAPTAARRGTTKAGLRKALAGDLDAVVLHALEKSPARRYPSAEAFLSDIDRWLGDEPVRARPPSAAWRARKFAVRHRVGVGVTVVTSLLLVVAAATTVRAALDARREAARAVAARDFLLQVFSLADSDRSGSADISARELLEGGQARAMSELRGQPRLQAEVLAGFAGVQSANGNFVAAEKAWETVQQTYEAMGDDVPLAAARLQRGENYFYMGSYAEAERQFATVASSPAWTRDARIRSALALAMGKLAVTQGRFAQGEASLREAVMSAAAPGDASKEQIDALVWLGRLDSQRGRYDEARGHLLRAVEAAARIPNFEASRRLDLEDVLATIDFDAGRLRQADERRQRTVSSCDEALGATDETCVVERLRLAALMLREGQDAAALAMVPKLMQKVTDDASPKRQADSLVIVCRILARNGRLPSGHPLRERLESVAHAGDDVRLPPFVKYNAALVLAEADLLAGDARSALAEADRVVGAVEGTAVDDMRLKGWAYGVRGLAQQGLGRHDEALVSLAQSQAHIGKRLGARHPLTVLYDLHRCRSQVATGERGAALAALDAALPVLQAATGESSPLLGRIKTLRQRLFALDEAAARRPTTAIEFFM